jgi:hypothetical protein
MELKTARLTLLIDPNKKAAFERLCETQDLTPSQVVRQLIRDYLAHHGVAYLPAGMEGGAQDEGNVGDQATQSKTAARAAPRRRPPKG